MDRERLGHFLLKLCFMTDPKLQDEMLAELKKSNELQKCIDETGQEKAKLDLLANVVRWVIAVPAVCYAILRTLPFFMG